RGAGPGSPGDGAPPAAAPNDRRRRRRDGDPRSAARRPRPDARRGLDPGPGAGAGSAAGMRPLPRLFAFTDDAVCQRDAYGIQAAAIASAGSAVAIVVRAPQTPTARRADLLERTLALVTPPEAAAFAHGDPALGRAYGAAGVQLRGSDLPAAEARRILPNGWVGVSVHSHEEARRALAEGAHYLVAGNVFQTTSHPGRPAQGLEWLAALAQLEAPVVAIGGMTPPRAVQAQRAGAWGVAAISALWDAPDPAGAAAAFLEPWSDA